MNNPVDKTKISVWMKYLRYLLAALIIVAVVLAVMYALLPPMEWGVFSNVLTRMPIGTPTGG